MFVRIDGRQSNQLREVEIIPNWNIYPEGSVLFKIGNTHVLCNVTIENTVPRWMKDQNIQGGWITAEYSLLPRATHTRTAREITGFSGRTQEIRRMIGRSLRASVNLEALGPCTCIVDCDVLQADGGTRTASITGGYVALIIALRKLIQSKEISEKTIRTAIAAISAGIVNNELMLDLSYTEDASAQADFNFIMNRRREYIEIQGTAESKPFSKSTLDQLMKLAHTGIEKLFDIQRQTIETMHQ